MIQKGLVENQTEVKRIAENTGRREEKLMELQTKMEEMKLQTKTKGQETVQNFPSGWAQGWNNQINPNQNRYQAAQAVPFAVPPSPGVPPSQLLAPTQQ